MDVCHFLREILTPFGCEKAISVFEEVIKHMDNLLHRARVHKIVADLCIPFIESPSLTESIHALFPTKKLHEQIDFEKKHDYHYTQAFTSVREAK